MALRTSYALPCAGLLVLSGASCASIRGHSDETTSPTTQRAMAAQKQSEEALKQVSEQAEKAAAAQEQVRQDEVKLRQDQETSRQEQAKAQQLQEQARQESQQAASSPRADLTRWCCSPPRARR